MKKAIAGGTCLIAVAMAFAAKDPVIMTVNGVDVPKSEFEYLYNKNSQQQINPQTLEEYVEMFKLYKMKVADAKAEGLDTLESFLKETSQYRHDLAAPYLADSAYINKLVDEAYARSQREVEAKHIMFFKTRGAAENAAMKARLDSLRGVIVNGGDFEELARQYSQDRGSSQRGGNMGFIVAGNFPYAFEEAAWSLPEGKISGIVESPMGYHLLKGGRSREARGKVKVSHILKLTQGKDEAGIALAKKQIDSLYNVVKDNPSIFAETATLNSEDPGSARQGGALPFFGAGEMVAEFDSVSFALKDGEISKPFPTSYGYHIVYRQESRPPLTYDIVKRQTLPKLNMAGDVRHRMIRDHQTARLAPAHKAKLNDNTVKAIYASAATNGLDSAFYASWTSGANSRMDIAVCDGKNTKAADFVATLNNHIIPDAEGAKEVLDERLAAFFNDIVTTAEEARLEKTTPEYRNLLREYIDGSLLYEVSVRKVWDKAAKDTEGQDAYFKAHRSEYKWDKPYVKGFFIQTVNDSVADLIKKRAAQLPEAEMVNALRQEFSGNIGVERVLVSQGANAMVDHVAFNGPKVEGQTAKFPVYFMVNERILTEPEEYSDVKGLVITDYQNMFQQEWENELRKKYPVTVNAKVLKTVKRK